MADELARAVLPRVVEREGAAGVPREVERREAGGAQVLVEHADRMAGDHVLRTGDRESGDRQTARERLELDDAERVGPTREDEDVGGSDMRGELAVLDLAEEFR